jgi:hypothetical protein
VRGSVAGFQFFFEVPVPWPQSSLPPCPQPSLININPILHILKKDICCTCDGSSNIKVFPLLFDIGMVISPL